MNKTINSNQSNQQEIVQQNNHHLSLIFWIICFLIMLSSLAYKELFLEAYSDDWRFFSTIHLFSALLCIAGVFFTVLFKTKVFDDDIAHLEKLKESYPLILRANRSYANDRSYYEQILDRFRSYLKLAKFLYFLAVIVLVTIFFIWDITQYFLVANAYVVSLTSDPGWGTTASQMYFSGLILGGVTIISSIFLRESVLSNAKFFTIFLHLVSVISKVSKSRSGIP